jgi:putative hydrolase of the HAD superfamily
MKQSDFAHVDTWIFDLDNTIYPARHNLFDQVDKRIGAFIAGLLDIDAVAARRLQKRYFREHGTTLRGLMLHHEVDPHDFLDFVHDIDLDCLSPSPDLDRNLGRLAGRKVIFTNGSTGHAEAVLARLGVADRFRGIFAITDADFIPKPEAAPYAALIESFRIDPRGTVMVEDIARNLVPAAALGMTTVWVRTDNAWGAEGSGGGHIHHVIDDVADWLAVLAG